jgi:hypothetical protein
LGGIIRRIDNLSRIELPVVDLPVELPLAHSLRRL